MPHSRIIVAVIVLCSALIAPGDGRAESAKSPSATLAVISEHTEAPIGHRAHVARTHAGDSTPTTNLALTPAVSIVIDDIGYNWPDGRAAVDLPGAVTCAFLPHTPYAARLARLAHAQDKQIILHLPMEALDGQPLGPGGLTLTMAKPAFLRTVRSDLASIPFVRGVNNHMGSLLTEQPRQMRWLMEDLVYHGGLFFLDSRTTAQTVAQKTAMNEGLPNIRRNVFLDDVQQPAAVRRQFEELIRLARRHGTALAIGHPHPVTLAVLRRMLPTLQAQGIRLVPVSELIQLKRERRIRLWQASLYP